MVSPGWLSEYHDTLFGVSRSTAIGIVIADDHPLFIEGLENVLRQEKDL